MKIIATAESCYHDKFGTPRQAGLVPAATAFLRFNAEFQPEVSLQGLEQFSHLYVIFHFHKNNTARFHAKVHPPRLEGESLGLFATRTPHRPNPIGLSIVKIESITKEGVFISGIDIIDKTPIFDIKPYIPQYDSLPEASAGWTSKVQQNSIEVTWSKKALNQLQEYSPKKEQDRLHQLIKQTIENDPRPLVYKGYESEINPKHREEHAIRIEHLDICFKFIAAEKAEIFNLKLL